MLINNVAYSWSMLTLSVPGITGTNEENPSILSGVTAIEWNKKQKVETNYGLGGEPANRGFGNREYTAAITMDYNTQVQLRAKYGSLMALGEFDLILSFANAYGTDDWTTETVTLRGCLFNEDGMEVAQDDTNITKKFDLNPFRIEMNTGGVTG
uniref:Putative XkdM-like protein n=1 Tax=virus sp. ctuZj11 TaxID=2825825 RepID=A0A8S5RAQ1_9VIRU|nr:MAG TPA: putative XkdM-like protein [virus sp. ctuZj11]